MYEHLDLLEQNTGIHITRLSPPAGKDFHYYLTKHKRSYSKSQLRLLVNGFGWVAKSGRRWCTNQFKRMPSEQYLDKKYGKYNYCLYISIAADEPQRARKDLLDAGLVRYPLMELGITEEEALSLCYCEGYMWGGLYEKRPRVSCWCCPMQNLDSLYQLYCDYPDKWKLLLQWDAETYNTFRPDYKLTTLDKIFKQIKENNCVCVQS